MRAGRINVIGVLLVLALAVGAAWLFTFGPYYWDHKKMDEVVKASARSWEGYSKEKAIQAMKSEMYNRDVPTYLSVEDCDFIEQGDRKTVYCEWTVQETWPLIGRRETMHFISEATSVAHVGLR